MPELERVGRWQAFKRLADHARKNVGPVARPTLFAQLRKAAPKLKKVRRSR